MLPHPLPDDYAQMNDDKRVAHWSAYLGRGMRWAGEDGYDEISILDANEIARLRAADPDIDRLMPPILAVLAKMWMEPIDAFFMRVNKQMGTAFEAKA